MPTKPWFLSKTIVSGIVGFVISILAIFHFNLRAWQGQIVDVTTQLAQAIFSVLALAGLIYGRVTATKAVTLWPKPKVTDATSPGRGLQVLALLFLSGCSVSGLVGCAGTGTSTAVSTPTGAVPVSTQLINIGYEAENFLQEFNTGTSTVIPDVDTFLKETGNSKDAATVALYSSLASGAAAIAEAALKAGLPPQQVQSAVSAQALAPSVAVSTAANVTQTQSAALTASATNTP